MKTRISTANNIVVVTGAGVSASSGISTWRSGTNAIWANDILEKGTTRYFRKDPCGAWSWYLEKFGMVEGLMPNPAHKSLADLEALATEKRKGFTLITQNVDHLHKKAGSKNVIEVHGKTSHVRCPSVSCPNGGLTGSIPIEEVMPQIEAFKQTKKVEDLPSCPICGEVVRAHALWFDESYESHVDYEIDKVVEALRECDYIMFIGTSFSVGVTHLIHRIGLTKGVNMVCIDPHPEEMRGVHPIRDYAEVVLPSLVKEMRV